MIGRERNLFAMIHLVNSNSPHPIEAPEDIKFELRNTTPLDRLNPGERKAREDSLITKAAQWGADQELEACCEWLVNKLVFREDGIRFADELRAARRPKPPSLAEQGLKALGPDVDNAHFRTLSSNEQVTIRIALKRLAELEANQ
jgi:hypothetical protein